MCDPYRFAHVRPTPPTGWRARNVERRLKKRQEHTFSKADRNADRIRIDTERNSVRRGVATFGDPATDRSSWSPTTFMSL